MNHHSYQYKISRANISYKAVICPSHVARIILRKLSSFSYSSLSALSGCPLDEKNIRCCREMRGDLPSTVSPSTVLTASTPFQNPSTKSLCLITNSSLTPYPWRLASIVFQESSSSVEASNTPSLPTPICVTCLKELGAGTEIMDRLMETEPWPPAESDFERVVDRLGLLSFIFLGSSSRVRKKSAKIWFKVNFCLGYPRPLYIWLITFWPKSAASSSSLNKNPYRLVCNRVFVLNDWDSLILDDLPCLGKHGRTAYRSYTQTVLGVWTSTPSFLCSRLPAWTNVSPLHSLHVKVRWDCRCLCRTTGCPSSGNTSIGLLCRSAWCDKHGHLPLLTRCMGFARVLLQFRFARRHKSYWTKSALLLPTT